MIRLSIIIPFHNVYKYIAECLDSVYNQDIPENEYEVICVNDASPDKSMDIVMEYQKKQISLQPREGRPRGLSLEKVILLRTKNNGLMIGEY